MPASGPPEGTSGMTSLGFFTIVMGTQRGGTPLATVPVITPATVTAVATASLDGGSPGFNGSNGTLTRGGPFSGDEPSSTGIRGSSSSGATVNKITLRELALVAFLTLIAVYLRM